MRTPRRPMRPILEPIQTLGLIAGQPGVQRLPRHPHFSGGRLPSVPMVEELATQAGFTVARLQLIGPHYVKTLQLWAAMLEARRDEAIAAQSQEVYDRYVKYLNGCVPLFREGYTNLGQFTLQK